jgi:hypothetical protein
VIELYGKTMALLLCRAALTLGAVTLVATPALTQQRFDKVQYLKLWPEEHGGPGRRVKDSLLKGTVVFNGDKKEVRFLDARGSLIATIPNDQISAMVIAAKDPTLPWQMVPDHYLFTIKYKDSQQETPAMVLILNRHNLRAILTAAPAETGKEVFHQDGCCFFRPHSCATKQSK